MKIGQKMTRILKHPDVRKAEIIQAASKLFKKKGYTNTPVEAIIKEAGIAKGTFYYYYKSKNHLLQAIINEICSNVEEHYSEILNNNKLTGIQKIEEMIRGPIKKQKINPLIMNILHKPENRELQEELNIQTIKVIIPLLHKAFSQGHEEGVFKRSVSIESMQIIMAGSQFLLDSGLFKWTEKKQDALLKSVEMLLELVTDAKPKSLAFISKNSGN
jgi:AcrR family transcriptional regulator